MLKKIICKHCGEEFIGSHTGRKYNSRKYCDECKNNISTYFLQGRQFDNKKPQICNACKKEFYAETKLKYCSIKCRNEIYNAKSRKKRADEALIREAIKEKEREAQQRQDLIREFSNILKNKIKAEYKKCSRCERLLPRTLEHFNKPDSKGSAMCNKCKIINRTRTEREGYRVCKKCSEELPATLEYFYAQKSNIYGVRAICKECRNEETKEYAEKNKDYLKEKSNEWRENNKEHCKAVRQQYRKNNIKKIRERKNKYKNKRRKADPAYKLNHNISRGINECLNGTKNRKHWEELVGYTKKQLVSHLESQFQAGMTWDNYGLYGWHVDHKRPVSSFNFASPDDEEFKQCWALENLQPLWAEDNLRKSDKWESA